MSFPNGPSLISAVFATAPPPLVNHAGPSLFQVIFVPLCAALAMRSLLRAWNGKTPRRTGLLATLLWSAATFVIAWPEVTIGLAKAVGIGRGADLVVYLAILAGISVCFYFYHRFRRMEILLTELVRREAVAQAEHGGSAPTPPHASQ